MKPSMLSLTLNEARDWYLAGRCTDAEYAEFCHLWQTSAVRFEVQACPCEECLKRGIAR